MDLIFNGKRKLEFIKLAESSKPEGAGVQRIRKGYRLDSDYYALIRLLKHGYVEQPDHGAHSRFFITMLGAQALDAAIDKLLNSQVAA